MQTLKKSELQFSVLQIQYLIYSKIMSNIWALGVGPQCTIYNVHTIYIYIYIPGNRPSTIRQLKK